MFPLMRLRLKLACSRLLSSKQPVASKSTFLQVNFHNLRIMGNTSEKQVKYNLDVLCLQENKKTICFRNCAFYLMQTKNQHYSLGFLVRKGWTKLRWKAISDRIATFKGSSEETKFKVVNCYGPTQILANKHKDIYETFLQQLKTSIKTKNGQK